MPKDKTKQRKVAEFKLKHSEVMGAEQKEGQVTLKVSSKTEERKGGNPGDVASGLLGLGFSHPLLTREWAVDPTDEERGAISRQ